MTAEVALFNKSAIALAADSAVSIENSVSIDSSTPKANKIYNNAEKLFALTKHHPVALMIYESNELQGVPWELIIKSYRKYLGVKYFDTLQEYKNSFLSFTRDFYFSLPSHVLNHHFSNQVNEIIYLTSEIIYNMLEEDNSSSELSLIDKIDSVINLLLEQYSDVPYFDGLNEETFENTDSNFDQLASEYLSEYFDVENLTESESRDWLNTCNSFYVLCKYRLLRQDPFFKGTTGLVFAGYGDKEYFPIILECEVFGAIDNCIKFIRKETFPGRPIAGLKAFAQREEVATFMQGISESSLKNYMHNFTSFADSSHNDIVELIEKYVPEEKRQQVREEYETKLKSSLEECITDIKEHSKREHIDKVTGMIGHLPKNELAYMAESLVNLTAFKRKVSNESDSVGGPIDVAVISKGDGFVWIKRKHYFPPELNTHYGPKMN
ncbi:hypothetical protein K0L52_003256 [Vibrio fluvialis]|nr:hypothetical protein [Vibrio fluvialis]